MAAIILLDRMRRRNLRRQRVFRDRQHPLERYNDEELYQKFRFRRQDILQLTDELEQAIEVSNRRGVLPPVLQTLLALRFYATGSFFDVCGELVGVHASTACRTVKRVTEALLPSLPHWIRLPNRDEASEMTNKFFTRHHIPNTFGCIDGTQIRIQSLEGIEFINRKGYYSINVQVVCDADLFFIDVIAKWPGSVHDDEILRQSPLFKAMESNSPPVEGHLLGDGDYVLRNWLITPVASPRTPEENNFNVHHEWARSLVVKTVDLAKRRWRCLRRLRVTPDRACQIITACFILHNRARSLALPDPDPDGEENKDDDEDESAEQNGGNVDQPHETARVAAGTVVRNQLIASLAHLV